MSSKILEKIDFMIADMERELEKVRTEIKKCDSFQLQTDKLFFNEYRKELGKIDYIVEKLPNLKKGSGGKSIKIKK